MDCKRFWKKTLSSSNFHQTLNTTINLFLLLMTTLIGVKSCQLVENSNKISQQQNLISRQQIALQKEIFFSEKKCFWEPRLIKKEKYTQIELKASLDQCRLIKSRIYLPKQFLDSNLSKTISNKSLIQYESDHFDFDETISIVVSKMKEFGNKNIQALKIRKGFLFEVPFVLAINYFSNDFIKDYSVYALQAYITLDSSKEESGIRVIISEKVQFKENLIQTLKKQLEIKDGVTLEKYQVSKYIDQLPYSKIETILYNMATSRLKGAYLFYNKKLGNQ